MDTIPEDAVRFLAALSGDRFTFQTYPDRKDGTRGLSRTLHGTLAQQHAKLAALNAKGAAVCVLVNQGDGEGRKTGNVQAVRAVFVDLDGSPLEPVTSGPLAPHITVESSPGRFHAYWRVADCPPADFARVQKALAKRFTGDPSVHDLPRVMRLPGYQHNKGEPVTSRLLSVPEAVPYTFAEIVAAFGIETAPPARARLKLPERIPEGQRNEALFKLAFAAHRQGIPEAKQVAKAITVNAARCDPPLPEDEVREIVTSAYRQDVTGFAAIPYSVIDSPAFKALDSEAMRMLVLAYRRFNGHNNGAITLAWSECREYFTTKCRAFERARKRAVASGLLIKAQAATTPSKGRRPQAGLYRLPAIASTSGPYQEDRQGPPVDLLNRYTGGRQKKGWGAHGPEHEETAPTQAAA